MNRLSRANASRDALYGVGSLALFDFNFMNVSTLKDPAKRCEWVFGMPMKACPECSGYNIGYSTPIKLDGPMPGTAKGMLGAWARARKNGQTPLEGTCRIMCRSCGHLGPAVDVTGRTSEDVGRDKAVADEVKRLWNNQSNVQSEPHGPTKKL